MRRTVCLILAALALCAALAGCSGAGVFASGGSGLPAERYRLGVLMPQAEEGWEAGVAYYARKYCEELAAEGQIDYEFLTSAGGAEMAQRLEELGDWGAQAVVFYPQGDGWEAAAKALLDRDVYLVSFEKTVGLDEVYRVSGDSEDMGRQCARYIVGKIGETGDVVLLNAPTGGAACSQRQKGFEEALVELAPNMRVKAFATDLTPEAAQRTVEGILAAEPKIDAVFAMDDLAAMGALAAISEAGRADIQVVTGGGGRQAYLALVAETQGLWAQTALYSPAMVEDAVDNALALLRGETVERVKIIPSASVDRENAADYLDEDCPY